MSNNKKFIPVRGKEQNILAQPYNESCLYFSTDTKKIFIDANNINKIPVGSNNSGIFFGTKTIAPVLNEENEEVYPSIVDFILSVDIEGEVLPGENDLILNAPDGCFYRVIEVYEEDETVTGLKLTVAGSGGGGGSSEPETDLFLSVDGETIQAGMTFIKDQEAYGYVTGTSTIDSKVWLTFEIKDSNNNIVTYTEQVNSGEPYAFDFRKLPVGSNTTLTISVSSDNTQMIKTPSRKITGLTVVPMTISKLQTGLNAAGVKSNEVTLTYIPVGAGLIKSLQVEVDGNLIVGTPDFERVNPQQREYIDFTTSGTQKSINIPPQSHGVHTIKLYLTTQANNGTILYSEPIEYEIAWADPLERRTPIIWVGDFPDTVINYETAIIPFAVYSPQAVFNNRPAEVHLYCNNVQIATSPMNISYNIQNPSWTDWDVSALYVTDSTNTFRIECDGASKTVSFYVTSQGSRDLGLSNLSTLQINMSSVGRSNSENSTKRNQWTSTGFREVSAIFNDFNWFNNGWKNDQDDNGSYLSVANGASLSIPLGEQNGAISFNGNDSYTFEMRFRVKNIQSYSTLVRLIPKYFVNENSESYTVEEIESSNLTYKRDADGNYCMDEANSEKVVQNEKGVAVKYLDSSGYGFCIGTQEAYFKTPAGVTNVKYKEDEIINIAFVLSGKPENLLSIYLNGMLSGAVNLEDQSAFVVSTNSVEINSKYCDIDIYKFRLYKSALSMPQVIHNYISDIHDITLYDQNQLTYEEDGTRLLYTKLVEYNEQHPEALTMPYAVWEIIDNGIIDNPNGGKNNANDDRLPYFKGNDRYVKITFVNPSLDLALEKNQIDEDYYYTHCPSFVCVGAEINVQGTSSQAYPRRNYKTKMKSATSGNSNWIPRAGVPDDAWGWYYTKGSKAGEKFKKWAVDSTVCSTNKFTWKIDYMESSGSYNTGFANLVGNGMYDHHPLYYYNSVTGKDGAGYRTSVYGFPVLVFHKHIKDPNPDHGKLDFAWTNSEDEWKSYEYIGRYNLNLDKSSNEYYGYEEKGLQNALTNDDGITEDLLNIFTYKITETQEINGEEVEVERVLTEEELEDYLSSKMDIAEAAECWELKDNQGTWTSFKYPSADERALGFGTPIAAGSQILEIGKHFEVRYNNEADPIEFIDSVGGNLKTSNDLIEGYENSAGIKRYIDISTDIKAAKYIRYKYRHLEELFNWLDSTDTSVVPNTDTGVALSETEANKEFDDTVSYMIEKEVKNNNEPITWYVDKDGNKICNSTNNAITFDSFGYIILNESSENLQSNEDTFIITLPNNETSTISSEDYEIVDGNKRLTNIIANNSYTGLIEIKNIKIKYLTDCAGYRLHKFKAEFEKHLNKDYCLVYFILTELLLCYDSRGKNMMLSTWGPTGTSDGNYVWFPTFYDIDTQLGLNNIGAVLWDYDADATIDGDFSTARSVLWVNFWNSFRSDIENKYRDLRQSSKLTEETIEGAYMCNSDVFSGSYAMKGLRPLVALGLDEYVKYIQPAYAGFYNLEGKVQTDKGYVYTCQGDRRLSRELLIRNRLNYIDSWWLAGDYIAEKVKSGIMIRANANDVNTSDKYVDMADSTNAESIVQKNYPVPYFDATPNFTITPFLSQYVTVFYDEDPITPSQKYNGINPVITNTTPSVENGYKNIQPYNEQLTYIPGGDFISSLGDLSLKYPSHFKLGTGKRLLDITLGSDIPGYTNGILGSGIGTFDLMDSGSAGQVKGLLQKLILTGITRLNSTIDLRGSEKIKEVRALNTSIPSFTFADGIPIDTLHLPQSTNALSLVEPKNLTKILETAPIVIEKDGTFENGDIKYKYVNDANSYKGLYIKNLTDLIIREDGSTYVEDLDGNETEITSMAFSKLQISGGSLGYDSFKLLKKAMAVKEQMITAYQNQLESDPILQISLENVEWSPYRLVEIGTIYDYQGGIDYYYLTDHNTFESYTYSNSNKWNNDILNEKLYTYVDGLQEELITDLSVLERFIEVYESADSYNKDYYMNANGTSEKTYPHLTGAIYVSNDGKEPIDEYTVATVYNNYWPDLKIYAANIDFAHILKYVQILDDGVEKLEGRTYYENSVSAPELDTSIIPFKNYYDFKGWSLDPTDNEHLVASYNLETEQITVESGFEDLIFSDENTTITLYAIFERHTYNVYFANDDGETLLTWTENGVILDHLEIPFGENAYAPTNVFPVSTKEDNLPLEKCYKFLGFARDPEATSPDNLSRRMVDSDMTFYAIYKEIGVYDNVLSNDYFTFTSNSYINDPLDEYKLSDGYAISIKAGKELGGKVTLPTYYNGKPITKIENFKSNNGGSNITHIFFDNKSGENKIREFGVECFLTDSKLKYIEIPNGLRLLGESCFGWCTALLPLDFSESSIYLIQRSAFGGTFAADQGRINLIFSNALTKLEASAFQYCNGLLGTLTLGAPGYPLTSLNTTAVLGSSYISLQNFIPENYQFQKIIIYCTAELYNESFLSNLDNAATLFGVNPDQLEINFA